MERAHISAAELSSAAGVRLIDIRKAPDAQQIPGSERRDGSKLEDGSDVPFTQQERVVLYCGSGNSCTRIAHALRERGYNVAALEGGYKGWVEAGFPTEPI